MAVAKKNNFATIDLDFAEEMLAKWKQYTLDNPYDTVEDRKEMQMTKTGGSFYTVVQTKEQIQKSLRDTLKDYLAMVEIVKRLRADEEAKKIEARGNKELSGQAKKWAENRQ
jgi:hypothetical protein